MTLTPAKGPDTHWDTRARCATNPDYITIFDRAADSGASKHNKNVPGATRTEVRRAATICHACPVITECAEWARHLEARGERPAATVLGGMWWPNRPSDPPFPVRPTDPDPLPGVQHGDEDGWAKHRAKGINPDGTWVHNPCGPCREAHREAIEERAVVEATRDRVCARCGVEKRASECLPRRNVCRDCDRAERRERRKRLT